MSGSGPKLSRRQTHWIRFVLDELMPPILRDQRWLMAPAFRLVYGADFRVLFDLKARAPTMTTAELGEAYERIAPILLDRETDLNEPSLEALVADARGPKVLEVGAGYGVLSRRLAEHHEVTATELEVDDALRAALPGVELVEGFCERLPFEDDSFDTVICAHTLEHVLDLGRAVAELRRVCRRRLLVVVPRQRPYRYTFDPHLHFFPYEHSLLLALRPLPSEHECRDLGGDLYYLEEQA